MQTPITSYAAWVLVGVFASTGLLFVPANIVLWPLALLVGLFAARRAPVWPAALGALNGVALLLVGLAVSVGRTSPCTDKASTPPTDVVVIGCSEPPWEPFLAAGITISLIATTAYICLTQRNTRSM